MLRTQLLLRLTAVASVVLRWLATYIFPVVQALQVVVCKGLALGRLVNTLILDALQSQI